MCRIGSPYRCFEIKEKDGTLLVGTTIFHGCDCQCDPIYEEFVSMNDRNVFFIRRCNRCRHAKGTPMLLVE